MKKNLKKILWASLLGLTLLGTAIISEAQLFKVDAGWGTTEPKTIEDRENEIPMWIYFNPDFRNKYSQPSPQVAWYKNEKTKVDKLWREVYFPENKNLPGGFVWYSIIPRDNPNPPLTSLDMARMMENNQNIAGSGGSWLVREARNKSYALNLKYGSINPWSASYNGTGTGTKTIKTGDFKGKNYEWRFLGYTIGGSAIPSPYFPADYGAHMFIGNTQAETDRFFANRRWIEYSWLQSYSIRLFGEEDELNEETRKIGWIKDYFLPQHPEYAKKGNAEYWAKRLRSMSDPSKETGVWVGWHSAGGRIYYVTMITEPPKQPNLRLIDYKIYDSKNELVAQQTRSTTDYYDNEDTVTIKNPFVRKGETYRIEVDVKNMPDVPKDINETIDLEHMYSFDEVIGLSTGYSTQIQNVVANAPNQNSLASGQVAHFTYNYQVPNTVKPKEQIQFNARIPNHFYMDGLNTNQDDDLASIILEIAPENLAVEFEGYYDESKKPVDYVTPGFDMWVKYRVTKTDGMMPVKGADLQIRLSDTRTTTNTIYANVGTFDKNNNPITDGILKNEGDYAIFWAVIKPQVPKVCTEASIPSKWASAGVNGEPSDDYVKPGCLFNPDNIVVSNFSARPKTTYLAKTQSSKQVAYTVTFDLTNYNFDNKDKDIPLVYTIDGKVVKTETVPVQSLKTMRISRILPAVNVGLGKHVVQVEANPIPRKYVEVKVDSTGKEVNPYADNIGFDNVLVERNRDDFACKIVKTSNYWTTTFHISTWHGYWVSYSCYWHGSHTYCLKNWTYSTQTVNFYEKQQIEHIYFRSKYTSDKYGGWVDLLNTKGTIKAGYGFEMKVVTRYQTNTYNDTPKPFNYGCSYGRHVSPGYTPVDSTARLKLTMPFTDDTGKPISIILNGYQSGSWYNRTTTYQLEERKVISKPERKIYINENTKNGNYNVRIETEPFYGSWDKPYTNSLLCDVKNVTIEVKGSYLDDMKTHIVQ